MSFFKIQFCFKRDWVTAITEERNNLKLFCTNAHNSKIKLLKIAKGIFGPFWIQKNFGQQCILVSFASVFHRILDFKRDWMSILVPFFFSIIFLRRQKGGINITQLKHLVPGFKIIKIITTNFIELRLRVRKFGGYISWFYFTNAAPSILKTRKALGKNGRNASLTVHRCPQLLIIASHSLYVFKVVVIQQVLNSICIQNLLMAI